MASAQDFLKGPLYDVNAHIAHVRKMADAYPLKGDEATHTHTVSVLAPIYKRLARQPAEHILELAYGTIALLFEKEGIHNPQFIFQPSAENPPIYLKASLHAFERTLSESYRASAVKVVDHIISTYLSQAPPGAFIEENDAGTKVPFYESVNVREWVAFLFAQGMSDEGHQPLFPNVSTQLMRNLFEASGRLYDQSTPPEKLTFPKDSKLDGNALIRAYLKDTPFHALLVASIPFAIPENTRFSGHWIIAPPNRGKTNLLLHQFEEDAKRNASILLMDSKGDLINPIRKLKSIQDRLVILEPSLEYPLAINPLDLGASTTHTVSFIEYVFSSLLEAEPTPLQSTLFRAVLLLMRVVPDATFADFRRVLVSGWKHYEQYIAKLDPEDQEFFTLGEFDSATYTPTKTQLLWRIRDLTTRIPLLRAMFRAPKTKIDIGSLMDAGKIVILDVRKQLLGDEGSEFLGRLYIALVRAAADQRASRPQEQKLPCYFYIDEAHTIIREDTKLAGIIQECRSQNIAMILSHQAISQISSQVTLGALSDCAIRMANSDEETAQLAPRLRTTPELLRGLPIGSFATFVRDTTRQAVTLRIPLSGVPQASQMDALEQAALTGRMREMYAYKPPPVVEKPEQSSAAQSPPFGPAANKW